MYSYGVEILQHGHCTALMFACITNRERCVELLLNKQADPNIRDKVYVL